MQKIVLGSLFGIVLGWISLLKYQTYKSERQVALYEEFKKNEKHKDDSIMSAYRHVEDSLQNLHDLQQKKTQDSLAKIVNPRLLKQEVRKLTTLISQKIPIEVTGFSNNGCTKKPIYYGRKLTLKSGAEIELNASGNLLFRKYYR